MQIWITNFYYYFQQSWLIWDLYILYRASASVTAKLMCSALLQCISLLFEGFINKKFWSSKGLFFLLHWISNRYFFSQEKQTNLKTLQEYIHYL